LDLTGITGELERRAGIRASAAEAAVVGGGSINRAFRLPSERGPVFLKINDARRLAMFEAEAQGLRTLRDAEAVRVPRVLDVGCAGTTAYLALEWVSLGRKTAAAEARLGRALARQHRVTAEVFGWHRDNTIGATPQPNRPAHRWLDFLKDRRLGFQLGLAVDNGLAEPCVARLRRLLARLDGYFDGYRPVASLLHGDLWSGNWGATPSGEPYVFDPAVYFGDREADLAMTRLFGGFGQAFYESYDAEWPPEAGWEARVDLYNLYHLLNHFNLFGGGYQAQVASALERLADHCG
jgi:fructosamine-3-kinase